MMRPWTLGSLLLLYSLASLGVSTVRSAEPVKQAKPATPWDYTAEPRPYAPACYDNFQNRAKPLTLAELNRWLVRVPDHPWQATEATNRYGVTVQASGRARLAAPWREDAVLRLGLEPTRGSTIHFWNGRQGVTLRYNRSSYRRAWNAYRTTFPPGKKLLIGGVTHQVSDTGRTLLATDQAREWRSHAGAYHFRYQQGELRMMLGDSQLLAAPLDGPPTQVTVEMAKTTLYDIGLFRGTDWPQIEPMRHRPALATDAPAGLPWREVDVEGAELIRHRDGSVELAARDPQQPVVASFPLRRRGLYEVLWRIEHPAPGVGVVLADDAGQPVAAAGFLRSTRTGKPVLSYEVLGKPRFEKTVAVDQGFPQTTANQWLRAVIGGGRFRVWMSADGRNWAPLDLPVAANATSFGSVGLFVHQGPGRRSIRLSEVIVRELSALTELAPLAARLQADRVAQSLALTTTKSQADWLARVVAAQPAQFTARDWRRACALATLSYGPPAPLANRLLEALADDAVKTASAPQEALDALDDTALLLDTQAPALTAALAARYEQVGRDWMHRGQLSAGQLVAQRMKLAPIWNHYNSVYTVAPLETWRSSLLTAVSEEDWSRVRDISQQIRSESWKNPLSSTWTTRYLPLKPVVDWSASTAAIRLPRELGESKISLLTTSRHPLIEQLSKEAYNTLAEVDVALNSEAYLDACRIIASASSREVGMLPDRNDPRLLVSLPTSVTLAMQQYPELRETMSKQFAPQGMLRVRQAMSLDDAASVKAATVQFHGTAAAAEAHRWLGDRQLSTGRFHQAVANYRRAQQTAPFVERAELAARRRLAAAMLGLPWGEPLQRPIEFGETVLSPEQFEQMVNEMLTSHNTQTWPISTEPAPTAADPLVPAGRSARLLANFAGQLGSGTGISTDGVHWPARQLALASSGDLLLAANRYQVVAYAADSGQQRWTYGLGSNQASAAALPLVRMRPVVAGDQVLARLLPRDGRPQLVALARDSGQLAWATSGWRVASDPVVVEERIFVVVIDSLDSDLVTQVALAQLDPVTGAVLHRWPLMEVNDNWQQYSNCEVALAGDRIIVATAGCLLATDFSGVVAWLRRESWLPVEVETDIVHQHHAPPVIEDDRIYAAQPGVRTVECVDAITGRLHWRTSVPHLARVVGLSGELLLIETTHGLTALELEQGLARWHYPTTELRDVLCDRQSRHALLLTREPTGLGTLRPTLLWLDLKTHQPVARWPLAELDNGASDVGPLARFGNRLICGRSPWDGKSKRQGDFDLFELLAVEEDAAPLHAGLSLDQGLLPARSEQLQAAARRTLPAWELLSALPDDAPALHDVGPDQRPALATMADAATPALLWQRYAVPLDGPTRLVLECAAASGNTAAIEVRAGGVPLRQFTPAQLGAGEAWQPVEIDLSPLAGRTISLQLISRPQTHQPVRVLWRRAEIVTGG